MLFDTLRVRDEISGCPGVFVEERSTLIEKPFQGTWTWNYVNQIYDHMKVHIAD